jgi:hypothetical protein
MKKHRPRPAPRRKKVRSPGPPPARRAAWDAPITFEPEYAYDALSGPDPVAWADMDEEERLEVVELYHEHIEVELPAPRFHAAIHGVVENQLALGDETPVRATLERLMQEGLDRHEAIHAIGTALTDLIYDISKDKLRSDVTEHYYAHLPKVTAESWRSGSADEEQD